MTAASNYTEKNLLNAVFRGTAFPLPTNTYIALHTADPGEDGTNAEVSTLVWPSYVRRQAEQGDVIGTGWSAPAVGDLSETKNAKQITYPVHDGAGPSTITHVSVWDASTGGNLLAKTVLDSSRIVSPLDVVVFDINALVFTAS